MGNLASSLLGWPLGAATEEAGLDLGDSLVGDLCIKIQSDETEMAIEMIHMISDINKLSTYFGLSPLHMAAESGNTTCIEALLMKSANVNIKDCRLFTPLHVAAGAARASHDCIKMLLEGRADIDAKDIWGKTPLHRAIIYKQGVALHLLLEAGCDVNIQDGQQRTPLIYLAHYPYWSPQVINKVISHGANVNLADIKGKSPLYYAVLSRQLRLIKKLIHQGTDLNNQKPMKLAISKCYVDCVFTLLKEGATISLDLIQIVLFRLESSYMSQPNHDFLLKYIRMLKLLLYAYGDTLDASCVRAGILSLLYFITHQNARLPFPGRRHLPHPVDISAVIPVISILVAGNSIPLYCLQDLFQQHPALQAVQGQVGYANLSPLSYMCRTVIRNELARNRPNLLLAAGDLTCVPPLIKDFILLKEYG